MLILLFVVNNCTTVGFHNESLRKSIDFGEEQPLYVCVLYEDTISKKEVDELEKDWAKELALYKINLKFKKTKKIERQYLFMTNVLDDLIYYKLGPECERILYMVGRTWGDILYEIVSLGIFYGVGLKFEVHGIVESYTNTRGVVKSKYVSLLQILFTSPSSTLIHEGYHLMGCPHMLLKDDCYRIIQSAKKNNIKNTRSDKIFSVRSTGSKNEFYSSEQVNYFFSSDKELVGDTSK